MPGVFNIIFSMRLPSGRTVRVSADPRHPEGPIDANTFNVPNVGPLARVDTNFLLAQLALPEIQQWLDLPNFSDMDYEMLHPNGQVIDWDNGEEFEPFVLYELRRRMPVHRFKSAKRGSRKKSGKPRKSVKRSGKSAKRGKKSARKSRRIAKKSLRRSRKVGGK